MNEDARASVHARAWIHIYTPAGRSDKVSITCGRNRFFVPGVRLPARSQKQPPLLHSFGDDLVAARAGHNVRCWDADFPEETLVWTCGDVHLPERYCAVCHCYPCPVPFVSSFVFFCDAVIMFSCKASCPDVYRRRLPSRACTPFLISP